MTFKKIFSIALSIILIVFCASACKKPNSPTIENISSKEEEVKITLAETIEKTEVQALYKLGADINADASNVDIRIADRTAHIFFNMGATTEVVSFSVYENSVLGTTTLSGEAFNYGVLDTGGYYAVNLQSSTLFVFEKDGKLKKETKICDGALRFGVLDMSGQYVVYQKSDSNLISRYDILLNETKDSTEELNIVGSPANDKVSVYVKDSSGIHYRIGFEDFAINKTQIEAYREYVDGMGITTEGDYFTLSALSNRTGRTMAKRLGSEEIVIAAQEELFITVSSKNRHYFRFYNMYSGMATGEIEASGTVLDAAFVGEDYIFVALEDRNTSEKFFRIFNTIENENKAIFDTGPLDETVIYKNIFIEKETEASQEAERIAQEHKIRFFYGKAGADFKTDFSYRTADGIDVLPKLKVAEKVFAALPPSLLTEATAGREIWIYLCRDLDNKGTEYSKLAALTEIYNHKLILIDVSCSDDRFAELLCHEFAHILDDYMPQGVKDGYSNLTPENIKAAAYTNDYINISSDQYTPYDKDKNNVWFYNNYCRINEKEDRTITLGQMFKMYAVQSSGEFFTFENIKKKAGYLSKALEETFDYCKKTDNQLWEYEFAYSE